MPMGRPFDGFVEYGKRVSPTCLVHLERNRYSMRLYPDRFLVVAEGQLLCEHQRIIDRSHDKPGRTIYDCRHYLAVVQQAWSPAQRRAVPRDARRLPAVAKASAAIPRRRQGDGRDPRAGAAS